MNCPSCKKYNLTSFSSMMVRKKGLCAECWKAQHKVLDRVRSLSHTAADKTFNAAETMIFGIRNSGVATRTAVAKGLIRIGNAVDPKEAKAETTATKAEEAKNEQPQDTPQDDLMV